MRHFAISPRTILSMIVLLFIFISIQPAVNAYCTCSGSAYLQNLKVVSATDSVKVGDTAQFIIKGQRVNITYTYNPSAYFSCDQNSQTQDFQTSSGIVTWNSSDPSVINIDQNGVGTVLKQGSVTISAFFKVTLPTLHDSGEYYDDCSVSDQYYLASGDITINSEPLIFVPGISASQLGYLVANPETEQNEFRELWLGLGVPHDSLTLDASSLLYNPNIIPGDVLRFAHGQAVYGPLLNMLAGHGFREYKIDYKPERLTEAGCDVNQKISDNSAQNPIFIHLSIRLAQKQ